MLVSVSGLASPRLLSPFIANIWRPGRGTEEVTDSLELKVSKAGFAFSGDGSY